MIVNQAEIPEASDALDWAVAEISVSIERLIAALPVGADLTQVAYDLIHGVEAMGNGGEIAAILNQGLVARTALSELGIKI